jgi:hypothetical protein
MRSIERSVADAAHLGHFRGEIASEALSDIVLGRKEKLVCVSALHLALLSAHSSPTRNHSSQRRCDKSTTHQCHHKVLYQLKRRQCILQSVVH